MIIDADDAAAIALALLEDKRHNWRNAIRNPGLQPGLFFIGLSDVMMRWRQFVISHAIFHRMSSLTRHVKRTRYRLKEQGYSAVW